MALAMIDRQHWDDARKYAERAAARHDDPARAHRQIGEAYAQASRPKDAIRHLEEAHRLGTPTGESTLQLATAYAQDGRVTEALRTLRSVAGRPGIDPATATAVADLFNDMGLRFAAAGEIKAAIEAFEQGVRFAPRSEVARLNLAVAYAEIGRRDAAREEARRALVLNPSYQRARDFLAALDRR
jgi:tetratricopeptide (TPR) repeat protein